MAFLNTLILWLGTLNETVLKIGRAIAVIAIAAMVISILVQVFFRYVIGNALPWPDEFARFCMLWMTGLMAPVAYRHGGFVAIDMLPEFLGRRAAAILSLLLLFLSMIVLLTGIKLGWKHINSGWLFSSASLKIPLSLVGMQSVKLKLFYMYSSLWVGLILLASVNFELVLRSLANLFSSDDQSNSDRSPFVPEPVTESPTDSTGAS